MMQWVAGVYWMEGLMRRSSRIGGQQAAWDRLCLYGSHGHHRSAPQNKLVRAVKRMTLDRAPNVLVLQLKRFEFMSFGHKIMRKIAYPTSLDIAPYMV